MVKLKHVSCGDRNCKYVALSYTNHGALSRVTKHRDQHRQVMEKTQAKQDKVVMSTNAFTTLVIFLLLASVALVAIGIWLLVTLI